LRLRAALRQYTVLAAPGELPAVRRLASACLRNWLAAARQRVIAVDQGVTQARKHIVGWRRCRTLLERFEGRARLG
jgi:hypothetical protein